MNYIFKLHSVYLNVYHYWRKCMSIQPRFRFYSLFLQCEKYIHLVLFTKELSKRKAYHCINSFILYVRWNIIIDKMTLVFVEKYVRPLQGRNRNLISKKVLEITINYRQLLVLQKKLYIDCLVTYKQYCHLNQEKHTSLS
jgi:hypothetical protein